MKGSLGSVFSILALVILISIPGTAWAVSAKVSSFGGGHQIWFEAEDYDLRDPDTDEFYLVAPSPPAGAFGQAMTRAGAEGGMIGWIFDISAAGGTGGTWYFWARFISPNNQSDYLLMDGDPDDVPIPTGPPYPGTNEVPPFVNDLHRAFEATHNEWTWGLADHSQGHTKTLKDGVNTMYVFHRQGDNTVFWDTFMWTDSADYVPTDDDYRAAESAAAVKPAGKLATVWGLMKTTQ